MKSNKDKFVDLMVSMSKNKDLIDMIDMDKFYEVANDAIIVDKAVHMDFRPGSLNCFNYDIPCIDNAEKVLRGFDLDLKKVLALRSEAHKNDKKAVYLNVPSLKILGMDLRFSEYVSKPHVSAY